MKILIYGLNYYPEVTGIAKYSGEMAEWLAAKGHDVRVITAPPYYPNWKVSESYSNWYRRETINGVRVNRCPLYVPRSNVTVLKRLLHLLSFTLSSLPVLILNLFWRPTVVINVVPALFTTPSAMLYSKLVRAKLVMHIQDFESDAMFGLGMMRGGLLPRAWGCVERFLLKRSSVVSTISNAMIENAISKGAKRENTLLFPNWSELSRFKNVLGIAEFKERLKLAEESKIILYSGNIGKKQGLELLVEAAALNQEQQDIHYVICGEGAAKKDLETLVAKKELNNVSFMSLQPYEKLPQLLAMADVHLVIQNKGVADAVLPSKLTNILAVGGNAVVTAESHTEMALLANKFKGSAIICEPEDVTALVGAINDALNKSKPNLIAIDYAQQFLDKESILIGFEKHLMDLC